MTPATQDNDVDKDAHVQGGNQGRTPLVHEEAAIWRLLYTFPNPPPRLGLKVKGVSDTLTDTMDTAQALAAAFLQTIPNGWEVPGMRGLGDLLDRCIRDKLEPEYDENADYVIQEFSNSMEARLV